MARCARLPLDRRGARARVHYNHNNFFSDGYGTTQLLHEVDDYYENPSVAHPPLTLSYREAVLGLERLAHSEAGTAARRFWVSRLPDMPPPPAVPLKRGLNRRCRSRLHRREGALDPALWSSFKRNSAALGVALHLAPDKQRADNLLARRTGLLRSAIRGHLLPNSL